MKKFIFLFLVAIIVAACSGNNTSNDAGMESAKMGDMGGMEKMGDMGDMGGMEKMGDMGDMESMTMMNAVLTEWSISLEKNEAPAGKAMFHVMNEGVSNHKLKIEGNEVSEVLEVKPGEMKMLTLDLSPGEYKVSCPMSGHLEKGMITTLITN